MRPRRRGELIEGAALPSRGRGPQGRGWPPSGFCGIGAAAAPIKAEIVTFRPDQELVWRSKLIAPGLFDRDHIFRIEPTETGCRLKQIQGYAGTMAPVAGMLTSQVVRHGLNSMNEALKKRVQQLYSA